MLQVSEWEAVQAATGQVLPEPLQGLAELARNYWWSWSAQGASLFRDLDPDLWDKYEQNPRRLLTDVADLRLAQMAADPAYTTRVQTVTREFEAYVNDVSHWRNSAQITHEHPVAYFCAEFGVHHSLPLYSGGLGILAGDHLKSASDVCLPLVAVGLMYRYGYFRQRLTRDGWQQEHYGESDPAQLPVEEVLDERGQPLQISVTIRGHEVWARVWRVDVGRVALYLLDTYIDDNDETDRWITGHLYGGDRETRVVQEMLLGIGGARLLRALGIEPCVYHLNEGHSAFLTLELAREIIAREGVSFAEAQARVREQCVFTTHTPVAAGNDEFTPALIEKCFGADYEQALGLNSHDFLALGRTEPDNPEQWYGLSPLAIKMCRSTNGVSEKHGEVSRELWHKLWPERSLAEVPITSVTNGVHAPTWVSPPLRDLFERYVGADWSAQMLDAARFAAGVERIPDEELWRAHSLLKKRLVSFIRYRAEQTRVQRNEPADYVEAARHLFDPDALTIGFARRVAAYKRWSLILTDPERIRRLLGDEQRPIQFVFAGKAHPQDQNAKMILQQLSRWKYDPLALKRAVFLQDYDQEIARYLVHGVDVWLNVPRRPLEASGTSGEKVALNGGLNLSILDGWWVEGYDGGNGWAIGDLSVDEDVNLMDAEDAASLYRALEDEVIPAYYERDADNFPRRWVRLMKNALATLGPKFNSDRMVADYARTIYTKQ
jgi:starch phosphorylase